MAVVEYEVRDRVGYITLNRPEKLNALNYEVRQGLWNAFTDVQRNPDVWIGVLTGTGRSFSVGGDLSGEGGGGPDDHSAEDLYALQLSTWKPLVAAVNGLCLALGGGLALCCDIRIASDQAQFGWPHVKRGIGSESGTALLPRYVPVAKALELLLTGEFIGAEEALRIDLVNRVVAHESLMSETEAFVDKLRENAPIAMQGNKEAVLRGLSLGLEDRFLVSRDVNTKIGRSEDSREGVQAFREKRKPVWQGR